MNLMEKTFIVEKRIVMIFYEIRTISINTIDYDKIFTYNKIVNFIKHYYNKKTDYNMYLPKYKLIARYIYNNGVLNLVH
jgi:hypothetical protein